MDAQDQRPTFYEGQYLAADDMGAVVDYGHVQSARHEIGGHSWGIVSGLTLVERPTTGAPQRCDVILTPGMAEDGFGRKLLALAPARLSETLFAGIAYDAGLDDPASNGGSPKGRLVKVWLTYDEQSGQAPAAGFGRCDADGATARVKETYRIVVGDQTNARSSISIAAQAMDAADALTRFNPSAATLYDASVPHQQFPGESDHAFWFVPIGYVRWVAAQSGTGYFADRNVPPKQGDTAIRQFRVYQGAVAERLYAPDRAIVLCDRAISPTQPGFFQSRLNSGDQAATLLDLAWVEGNLRVVGDGRLAGGALRFATKDGVDEGVPMSIERRGDVGTVTAPRSLNAVIGLVTQTNNRFAVATANGTNPTNLVEKLTVMSGGNVGVGNDTPAEALHVKGDAIRLDSTDGARTVAIRTDTPLRVSLETATSDLHLRTTGTTGNVVINPDATNGNVGIGTATPAYKLDVKSKGIKLGLEDNGGGQLILVNNPNDNKVWLEGYNTAGTGSANAMLLTGWHGNNLPRLVLGADITQIDGKVGIGVPNPAVPLHVAGPTALFDGNVGIGTTAPLAKLHVVGSQVLLDGNVAIGSAPPTQKLHVQGEFALVEGLASERAYIGGDGIAGDVQLGSLNPSITYITCWNAASNSTMSIHASSFPVTSDAELKENVQPLSNALDLVQRLRGVRFDWKGKSRGKEPAALGVIAQEVALVLPEVVGSVRGHATVDYSAIVPVLIEAIKELKQENQTVKSELRQLTTLLGELAQHVGEGAPGAPARTEE
ncbi:MAG TPA: tail fiber domain-containing protein [Rhizomicrobium sp.]